jgi:hypothetical protein
MIRWIKNPPALMPGTKMPVFYDPEFYESSGPEDLLGGDENEQIRVLRDYLLTLADKPQGKAAQKSAPASTENSGEATVESPTPQPPASDLPATP